MFINPDLATRLAREHHQQLLAHASRRQPRPRPGRRSPGTPGAAGIGRRLAAVIARAGSVAAQSANAIWLAVPHPLGEPAGQAQAPDGSH
jgi:hypothetical protein